MCDRLSRKHGYICNECFSELVALGVTTNIKEFMNSDKQSDENTEASMAYFEKVFKLQEYDSS